MKKTFIRYGTKEKILANINQALQLISPAYIRLDEENDIIDVRTNRSMLDFGENIRIKLNGIDNSQIELEVVSSLVFGYIDSANKNRLNIEQFEQFLNLVEKSNS